MGAESTIKPRRGYARKVEIDRAIAAIEARGLPIASIDLSPDGSFRINIAPLGGIPKNDFDRWEDRL